MEQLEADLTYIKCVWQQNQYHYTTPKEERAGKASVVCQRVLHSSLNFPPITYNLVTIKW